MTLIRFKVTSMTTKHHPYPTYRPSGVEWLGDVPDHWEVRRLRSVAEMRVSNVDKHSREDEYPVRLCNYVDVYKNDRITQAIPFMSATASWDEIERFRLEPGDVLITKDSEAWDDIGVPSLVVESADDLLSGYHLALLRPFKETLGAYLALALRSTAAAYQFHVRANGVTRYGLTHAGIQSVQLSFPPLPEQHAIVRYLDYVDRRVRRYVGAERRLIALLEEEEQAIVNRAVTRGLDPNVPLKSSGVDWLGDVPAHWEVRRAKFFYREADERSTTGTEELMSVSHITGVTPRKKSVTMFLAESNMGYKLCRPDDIVINTMWAYMAALGVARQNGLVSPSYGVYRPLNTERLNRDYVDSLLRTEAYRANYLIRSTGITSSRLRLYPESFLDIHLVCPPRSEQDAIIEHLERETAATTAAIARARRQIVLVQEYRTRLIADVVTGKLDVRDAAAQLPEEAEEDEPIDENGLVADNGEDRPFDVDGALED
ncbi:MAG: restriction endonuclease subunit S [Dehalococcoidia bacterium]|nr:restriction endonuclease subunit S [Dehalococcoidia bacterium]